MPRRSTQPYVTDPPGVNVWRLRAARGWSQRALADHCKPALDHTTIRRIEHNLGYTQDTLERIAAALRVPIETLLLPVELDGWTRLSADARARLAALLRDTVEAETARRTR